MKKPEFKAFKSAVIKADAQNSIWWAGYYWIDLTGNQCREMLDLLETKPFIKRTKTIDGKDALLMPSGLMIHYKIKSQENTEA